MSARDYIARLWTLRKSFRETFHGPDGKPHAAGREVLLELRRFCYGGRPTIKAGVRGVDPYASIAAAARQEVYLRILSLLNTDDADLHLMAKNMENTADG